VFGVLSAHLGSFYKNALYKFTVITVINIKCVVHDDLGRKNQTTQYILPRHWLYDWFSQFPLVVELIPFFHGALQLVLITYINPL